MASCVVNVAGANLMGPRMMGNGGTLLWQINDLTQPPTRVLLRRARGVAQAALAAPGHLAHYAFSVPFTLSTVGG